LGTPYGLFQAKDGHVTIGASGGKRWPIFCRLVGGEEWLADERFATDGVRFEHKDELIVLINEKLQAKTVTEWEGLFNEAGIPCGPLHDMSESLTHPQVLHREMVVE